MKRRICRGTSASPVKLAAWMRDGFAPGAMLQALRGLALAALLGAIAGCAATAPRPDAVPVRIDATGVLNPDDQGRSLSVVLRVYALRSAEPFAGASFDALLRRDAQTLGPALASREEIVVAPGDAARTLSQPLAPDTTHIGVMGLFRRPDPGAFRAVIAVDTLPRDGIVVRLEGCGLRVAVAGPARETQMAAAGADALASARVAACGRPVR